MATIDELMKDKKPGEVKITKYATKNTIEWHSSCYFRPFFKDETTWRGLYTVDNGGDIAAQYHDADEWKPYEEPKKMKKVVLYQWWHKENCFLSEPISEETVSLFTEGDKFFRVDSTRLEIEVPE